MGEEAKKERKPRAQRLYTRRWCRPCNDCGAPIVFLDNPRPAVPGKRRPNWVLVELYGERDGVLMPWGGEIAFDPRLHVEHYCVRERKRLAWIIRQAKDDL